MANNSKLPRWQVRLPMQHLIIAELVVFGAIASVAHQQWWWKVAAALPVLVAAGLWYRGATALGWLRRWLHRPEKLHGIVGAFTVELPGVGPVGLRADGRYAVTAIALHGRSFAASVLVPDGAETFDTVPLDAITGLLTQFGGLELHSIDVVSVGSRVAPNGRYTPRYDEIIGDRPAVGDRTTWLILRLCPLACLKALAYRGDVGVAIAAATERIRQAAIRAGCRASSCNAEQLGTATRALLGGHELERFEERWLHLRAGNDYVSSYRIAGQDLTSRVLSDMWTIQSRRTVITIRLTRNDSGAPAVAAMVRLHTKNLLTHPPTHTLQSLPGQQLAALHASLALGDRSLELDLSARELTTGRKGGLLIPVGPCGPMLGKSIDGVPFLMPLTDPMKYVVVAIDADFDVAATLLLRATAAGLTGVIHTDRPQVWEGICDDRMMLAGVQNVNTPELVIADGDTESRRLLATTGERGHALVVLGSPPPDCDVVITQVTGRELAVRVGLQEVTLDILWLRNEAEFLR